VLGHFRHEVGIFLDVLVRDVASSRHAAMFFGSETADYGQALQTYYATAHFELARKFHQAYATRIRGGLRRDLGALPPHCDTLEMARARQYVHPRLAPPGN